jgi:putative RNA 2'-phosphotransferase
MKINKRKISMQMSYLLRHDPEDLVMDKNGWVNVIILLAKLRITFDELKDIVLTNDKKRFAFNDEETQIRASQGHSLKKIDVELKKQIPPKYLYHGTAARNLKNINKKGLQKMNRNHVHLSSNHSTALIVAERHCKNKNENAYVFKINTTPMMLDGINFYISANGIWLVDEVKPKYF